MSDLGKTQTDIVRDMQRKHADEIQRLSHDLELLLAREKGLKAERDEWFTVARDAKQLLEDAMKGIEKRSALITEMLGTIDQRNAMLTKAYERLTAHGIDIHGST